MPSNIYVWETPWVATKDRTINPIVREEFERDVDRATMVQRQDVGSNLRGIAAA